MIFVTCFCVIFITISHLFCKWQSTVRNITFNIKLFPSVQRSYVGHSYTKIYFLPRRTIISLWLGDRLMRDASYPCPNLGLDHRERSEGPITAWRVTSAHPGMWIGIKSPGSQNPGRETELENWTTGSRRLLLRSACPARHRSFIHNNSISKIIHIPASASRSGI